MTDHETDQESVTLQDVEDNPALCLNDDGTITVLFRNPIVSKNPKIPDLTELTLRVPTIGDMEAADSTKGKIKQSVAIVSALTGVTPPIVRKIPMPDFQNVSLAVAFLMEGGDDDGKKFSATGEV